VAIAQRCIRSKGGRGTSVRIAPTHPHADLQGLGSLKRIAGERYSVHEDRGRRVGPRSAARPSTLNCNDPEGTIMKAHIETRTLVGALALAGALAAPTLASAQTACAQWDLSQPWVAVQGDYRVEFHLNQRGTRFDGTASYFQRGTTKSWVLFIPTTAFGTTVSDRVTGKIDGDAFELQTQWGGVYVGRIDATGRIDGDTYDKRDSTSSAKWYSDRRMGCRQAVPVPEASSSVLTPAQGSTAASVFGRTPRPAPTPAAVPTPVALPAPASVPPGTCKGGYVWRVARPADLVCVTPDSRARVAAENQTRASRVQPGGGAYGPNTCKPGFVWREAYVGDGVCVTPQIRALVFEENRLAASRRVQS
jgi:hypothetical protein